MTKKEKGAKIVEILREHYSDDCSLEAMKDYELLFAVRLAAQCTDARVNQVTPMLFARFPSLEAFAAATEDEIGEYIKSCGLFRTKARDLRACAVMLLEEYGGKVPDTMEDLLRLPGVGRKTANLILSDIFGQPAVVTDTHCIRIAHRLGLTSGKDPYKTERELAALIEPQEQASLCHRFVHFGRDICTARAPQCNICPLAELCPSR